MNRSDVAAQADALLRTLPEDADLKMPDLLQPLTGDGTSLLIPFLVLLLVAGIFFWAGRRRKGKKASPDREKEPHEKALNDLMKLREGKVSLDAFHVALSRILKRYLRDRFSLEVMEKTTEEVERILASAQVMEERESSALLGMVKKSDLVKFSGKPLEKTGMEEDLAAAVEWVHATEERGEP